jgi:hypothetical protein
MSEQAPERTPQRGGFSLTKRYGPLPAWAWGLIGGVGVYAVYRLYKNRQAAGTTAAASTASTTGSDTPIDYAPQISVLQSEIQQLQGEESTEPVDKDTVPHPPPKPPPPGGRVRVPDVVGQRAASAISTIEAAGLEVVTSPFRNPKREYTVTGQTPRAGAMVPKRSVVTLRVKVSSKAAPPKGRTPRKPLPVDRKA